MFTHLGNAVFMFEMAEFLEKNKPFEFKAANRIERRHPEGIHNQDFGHVNDKYTKYQYKVIPSH